MYILEVFNKAVYQGAILNLESIHFFNQEPNVEELKATHYLNNDHAYKLLKNCKINDLNYKEIQYIMDDNYKMIVRLTNLDQSQKPLDPVNDIKILALKDMIYSFLKNINFPYIILTQSQKLINTSNSKIIGLKLEQNQIKIAIYTDCQSNINYLPIDDLPFQNLSFVANQLKSIS